MMACILFLLHRGIDSFVQRSKKMTKQCISMYLFIFTWLWPFPCMGMEMVPVDIVDRREVVLAVPVIDEFALQDLQIKEAFRKIENASLYQLEEFVCEEINKIINSGQMRTTKDQSESLLYTDGPSLQQMVHDLILWLSQDFKDILQEKDAKERAIMIQSIFFYVLYYMRSLDSVTHGDVRHVLAREFMRTSFEIAITMITDYDFALFPFNKDEIDDEAYVRMRDAFKRDKSFQYDFLKGVAYNKLPFSLLLMKYNVPLNMPLSTMISIAQEFEQFVTPRM